jgi:hypothetical protein
MIDNTSPKKILILSANPKGSTPLRLAEEVREIEAGLQRAQNREQFELHQKWAVRPRDIRRAMVDVNPHIVQFSGHGAGEEGLVFEDEETGRAKLIDGDALAGLFGMFPEVECVVLNACYSEIQATAIAQHIPYVIGMNQGIGDKAAIEFAVGFYDALGAGRDVKFAYQLGCNAIRMAGISEYLKPVLKEKFSSSERQKELNELEEYVRIDKEVQALTIKINAITEQIIASPKSYSNRENELAQYMKRFYEAKCAMESCLKLISMRLEFNQAKILLVVSSIK